MYHGVTNIPFRFPVWTQIATQQFEQHIRYLSQSRYTLCSMSTLIHCLREKISFPKHAVAITFDDGFLNNITDAYPILTKYNVPATIYLTAGLIGTAEKIWTDRLLTAFLATREPRVTLPQLGVLNLRSSDGLYRAYRQTVDYMKTLPCDMKNDLLESFIEQLGAGNDMDAQNINHALALMSWDDAREIQSSGLIEFGGHTCHHEIMTRMKPRDITSDLQNCKNTIDSELGIDCSHFAYPNGSPADYNELIVDAVGATGWQSAVTTTIGHTSNHHDRFRLPRFGIGAKTSVDDLEYAMSGINQWNQRRLATRLSKASKAVLTGTLT